jgi:hypothetical protein
VEVPAAAAPHAAVTPAGLGLRRTEAAQLAERPLEHEDLGPAGAQLRDLEVRAAPASDVGQQPAETIEEVLRGVGGQPDADAAAALAVDQPVASLSRGALNDRR